jgi:hypothetical protein
LTEPENLRNGLPRFFPKELMDATPFDPAWVKEVMGQIALAIQKRL